MPIEHVTWNYLQWLIGRPRDRWEIYRDLRRDGVGRKQAFEYLFSV